MIAKPIAKTLIALITLFSITPAQSWDACPDGAFQGKSRNKIKSLVSKGVVFSIPDGMGNKDYYVGASKFTPGKEKHLLKLCKQANVFNYIVDLQEATLCKQDVIACDYIEPPKTAAEIAQAKEEARIRSLIQDELYEQQRLKDSRFDHPFFREAMEDN